VNDRMSELYHQKQILYDTKLAGRTTINQSLILRVFVVDFRDISSGTPLRNTMLHRIFHQANTRIYPNF
jgi:hypothetical protein